MNFVDLILLIGLLWAARKGWQIGLVQSLIGLISLVLSYGLALRYGGEVAGRLTGDPGDQEGGVALIGFLAVFLVTLAACYLAGRLLRSLLRASPLGILDTLGGAAIGLSKGVLVLGLLTVLLHANPLHSRLPGFIDSALLVPHVQRAALVLSNGIQALFPSARDLFQSLGVQTPESPPPPIVDKIKNEAQEARQKLNTLIDESREKLDSKLEKD